jgi:shikimate kinase
MGVGKGTIARALVKRSNNFQRNCNQRLYFAIDTDDLIESIENKKINKIFKQNGERYFRSLEKRCALWCEKNLKNTIISTGGGFYKQENIKKIGKIIYLKSSFNRIIEALKEAPNSKNKFKKRPLLKNLEEAEKLYNIRVEEYKEVADIIIDVENWNIQKITKDILEKINENNKY